MQKITEKSFNLCSIFIIMLVAVLLFLLRYSTPLYGDDIGGLVKNNPDSIYLDDYVAEGKCKLDLDYSLRASWDRLCDSYSSWDGRVVTKIVTPFIRMIFSFTDGVNWMLFSLYIAGMLFIMFLLTIRTISGTIKDGIKEPALVMLVGALLFLVPAYSYAYMTRLIMYTFTNIYVISVILYLLFYILIQLVYERHIMARVDCEDGQRLDGRICELRMIIGINIVGLLAGLSHEAYGVIFGVVLLIQLIRFWLNNHRRLPVSCLFLYLGYLVGFCICFFAPGNFNRAAQSHELALRTVPLSTRLFNSLYVHAYIAYNIWVVPVIVLPALIVLAAVLLKKKILSIKDVIYVMADNLEWFLGFVMSAVTWGLVTRVTNYGMLAANVIIMIGVIRVIRGLWKRIAGTDIFCVKRVRMILTGISIAAVFVISVKCYASTSEIHQTAAVWRENIAMARQTGMEEIVVPMYPEELDYRFYDLRSINDQSRYDKIAARVVYGTHVILESNQAR